MLRKRMGRLWWRETEMERRARAGDIFAKWFVKWRTLLNFGFFILLLFFAFIVS